MAKTVKNIIKMDYTSLYSNIILSHNIMPERVRRIAKIKRILTEIENLNR